jgi:hypothetical protein
MPSRHALVASLLFLACATPARATTWFPADIDDPFVEGAKCEGMQPASWGSYIYHWPSKWHQVFWPQVSSEGVWSCPKSGFVAFMGDMEMGEAEAARVRVYLDVLPDKAASSRRAQLERLEAIYALRDKDPAFRLHLLRVLAYVHEDELQDPASAASYRADALAQLRAALGGALKDIERAEYLFVAAAYAREAGDAAQSDRDIAALEALLPTLKGDDANYAGYLTDLLPDLRAIEPGGVLAPQERERPVVEKEATAEAEQTAECAAMHAEAAALAAEADAKARENPGAEPDPDALAELAEADAAAAACRAEPAD